MNDQFPPYSPSPRPEPEPPGPVYGGQPADPQAPPPPQQGYGQPAYQPPPPASPYGGYGAGGHSPYGYQQSHSGATTSMVLGIVSVVMALLNFACCITGVVSIALGPVAIWMGVKARREIDAQPAQFGNRGMAVAGLATGIAGTALGVVTYAAVLLFFGLALGPAA